MTQCIRDVITAPYYALNAVNTYRKKKIQQLTINLQNTAQKIKSLAIQHFDDFKTISLLYTTWQCAVKDPIPFGSTAFLSFIYTLLGHDSENLKTGQNAIQGKSILENMHDVFSNPMKAAGLITLVSLPVLRGAVAGVIAADYFARRVSEYMQPISAEELLQIHQAEVRRLRALDARASNTSDSDLPL